MERVSLRRRWHLLLLALCLLLTGCGTQMDMAEVEKDQAPWQEEMEAPSEENGEETVPSATSFALAYHDGQSLDPITCGDGVQEQLTTLLYEPLFQLDAAFEPQPVLCSSYTVSGDGLEYTLHIRQGVTFSDGSLLESTDVVQALRRAMASQRYGNRLDDIRQVLSRDGTVVITLSRPNSRLPELLDVPVVKNGSQEDLIPIGTGPYLMVTSSEGAYLSANPDWWQDRALPVERIELVDAKDADTVLYLFTSREIQVYATDLTRGNAALSGDLSAMDIPTTTMQFIGVNVRHQALQDQALRQALALGIPRETVVDGYLSGHALPAQFPIAPTAFGYPETMETAYSLETYRQALSRLGEGEETGGQETALTLLVNADSSSKSAIAEYLAESLSLEGVLQIEVEALPWGEYLERLEQGNFDLYYGEVRLTADWDISELIGSNGTLNYGGWSGMDTDAILDAYRSGSEAEQRTLYQHLQEAVAIIPICFKSDSLLTHSGVAENMQPTASNIFYNFSDWTIHLSQQENENKGSSS